jgi:hypothetical protein
MLFIKFQKWNFWGRTFQLERAAKF